jgi:purine-binding chemotaxis protein CheW
MTVGQTITDGAYPMDEAAPVFCFSLDDRMFALPLEVVVRALFAVEVTSLPSAPAIVAGIFNYHGMIVPLVDIRIRFGLPPQEILPSDRFILIHTPKRILAVVASHVTGILKPSGAMTHAGDILVGARYISGVLAEEDRLIFIYDPDTFLLSDEEATLETALTGAGGEKIQ